MHDTYNTPKCLWLADLKQQGLLPKVEVLETECRFSGAFNSEAYWIQKMPRFGAPLTNVVSVNEKGWFTKQSPSEVNRIPSCKGTKLLCVHRTVLGVKRDVVADRAGLSTLMYGVAESGATVKYSIATTILAAINDLLLEQGSKEVVLSDLG